jgi:hypothetical protein
MRSQGRLVLAAASVCKRAELGCGNIPPGVRASIPAGVAANLPPGCLVAVSLSHRLILSLKLCLLGISTVTVYFICRIIVFFLTEM